MAKSKQKVKLQQIGQALEAFVQVLEMEGDRKSARFLEQEIMPQVKELYDEIT
jgi:hypothetical protein|tara:strand:+ start:1065 stop:1223 length:159 start_codon:yes stop_codon:yes gene_type:complete